MTGKPTSKTSPVKKLFLCAAFIILPMTATAQSVPRVKARIVSFDGKRIEVMTGEGKTAQALSIALMPNTRIMAETTQALFDIKPGDYVGATMEKIVGDRWKASEVHLFPASFKGANEGLFALPSDSRKMTVAGIVKENAPGILSLSFRGLGPKDGPECRGHAPANIAEGCQGQIQVMVEMDANVTALKLSDKSALVPGAVVAVSILAGPDGRPMTPGLTVQGGNPAMSAAIPAAK